MKFGRLGAYLSSQPWRILLVIAAVGLALTALHRGPLSAAGDGPNYVMGAYHLYHDGVFSEAVTAGAVQPGIGREPAYSAALAGLMAIDPVLRTAGPQCFQAGCDAEIYRSAALLNLAMTVLAGLLLFWVGRSATGRPAAGLIAAGYVLLNLQTDKGWGPIASDRLALLAVVLVLLAIAQAWSRGPLRWSLVGLALALLTLTKAIFLYYTLACAAAALAAAAANRTSRRAILLSTIVAALVYAPTIGGWIARNHAVSGHWQLTDARGGIALNTREVFNHMTPRQYAASFVYWMRGPGEGLARKFFPPEVVKPFDLDQPGGFYDTGQNGFGIRVAARMHETGEDYWTAEHAVEHEIVSAILSRPLTHLATTLPLFYRGLWGDEFIVIGLPLFFIALFAAWRERHWLMLTLFSLGLFNLLFYALFSLNIPRYQMTALPSMALAVGYVAVRWRPGRQTAMAQPGNTL